MIRSAWQLLRARRRRLAALGAGASATAGVVFATVAALNGWVFGYDFFDEPAPTPTADTVAVVCLWAMALLAVVLAVVVYGAMVLVVAGDTGGGDIGAGDALRLASRRAMTDWWRAIPAMALTVVLVALVLPCVVAAPIIGYATPRITRRQVPHDHVGMTIPHHAAISLFAGAVAAIVWGVLAVAAALMGDGPAPLPWLMAFLVIAGLGLAGSLAAAAVAAGAVTVLDHVTRPSPWPAPVPAAPSIGWSLQAPPPSTAPLPGPAVHSAPEPPAPRWWSGLVASDRSMLLLTIAGVVLLVAFGVTYVCNVLVMGDPGPDATSIDLARHESLVSDVTPWWLGTTSALLAVAVVLAAFSWRARRR